MTGTEATGNHEPPPLVTGQLVIKAATPAFQDGTAHILLEDVSRADTESDVVAEAVIYSVRHDPAGAAQDTVLPFAIHAGADTGSINSRNHYAVRVWMDRDGDHREGPGDLHSDRSYRVLTRGFGDTVTIALGGR